MSLIKVYNVSVKICLLYVLLMFAGGCRTHYYEVSRNEDFKSVFYKKPEIKKVYLCYFVKNESGKTRKALTLTGDGHLETIKTILVNAEQSIRTIGGDVSPKYIYQDKSLHIGFLHGHGGFYKIFLVKDPKYDVPFVGISSKKHAYFFADTTLRDKLTEFVKIFESDESEISLNHTHEKMNEPFFIVK